MKITTIGLDLAKTVFHPNSEIGTKVAPLCRFFEGIFLRFPPSIPTQVIRPPHV